MEAVALPTRPPENRNQAALKPTERVIIKRPCMVSTLRVALKLTHPSQDTPTRQAYRRVLRMMEDPDGADCNIFDEELDEDGNAIRKGTFLTLTHLRDFDPRIVYTLCIGRSSRPATLLFPPQAAPHSRVTSRPHPE